MLFDHLLPNTRKMLVGGLIGTIAVIAVLSLILTAFAPASFDDYCRAAWSKDIGTVLARVRDSYGTWTGRWVAHALYALSFPHINLTSPAYNGLLALSGPIWLVVFYSFLHILFRKTLSVRDKALFAALLCAIYWVGMPYSGETWYWLTGSVEYQIPFLLMALSLLVLTSSWITDPSFTRTALARKAAVALLGGSLAIAVSGLNEFIALFLLGGLAIAVVLAIARRRWSLVAIYGAVIALIAGGVMFNLAAPGTAARIAYDYPHPNDLRFGLRMLVDPGSSPIRWFGDARLLCLSALLITTPGFLKLRPAWIDWKLPAPGPLSAMAAFAPLAALAAVLAGMFAVSYAQGAEPPPRIMNMIYAVLIIGWIAALVPIGRFAGLADAGLADERPDPIRRGVNLGAAFLLPVTLLIAPNTLHAVAGIEQIAMQWRPQLNARYHDVKARMANGETDLVLTPITVDPHPYFWDDISADPADWRNDCMARFYGLRSMKVESSAASEQ